MEKDEFYKEKIKEHAIVDKAVSLARTALKNNFKVEARALFNEVLKLEPNNEEVIKELNSLEETLSNDSR